MKKGRSKARAKRRKRGGCRRLALLILLTAAAAALAFVVLRGIQNPAQPDSELEALLAAPLLTSGEAMPAPSPDSGCIRLRIGHIGGPLGRVFNDVNAEHLAAIAADGIEPFDGNENVSWRRGKGLVQISSGADYYLEELTHSYPYLRPHAAALLGELGRRFRDTLTARGGGDYRIKVTSVLRTPATVGRLRRVNRNATGESSHCYGTTFDVSYAKFICNDSTGVRRTNEDLKNLLGEILADMRRKGRCLVKYERRQGCFHITALRHDNDNDGTEANL